LTVPDCVRMVDAETVGVVIPTLNEAAELPNLLADLARVALPLDIVIADGGSSDGTLTVAREHGARVVMSASGRGRQLNTGATALAAPWLCVVHADVRMPQVARDALCRAVHQGADAAVWRLRIDTEETWGRLMEAGARVRDRVGGLPYGDQGLLVRRTLFDAVGGYPDVPIMEDVGLIRALGRRCTIRRLDASLVVSPRRWRREGPYRTWLRNTALLTAYLLRVPPHRLARWYRPASR
jgi:rSAM/selenodomain-associated transferase 2